MPAVAPPLLTGITNIPDPADLPNFDVKAYQYSNEQKIMGQQLVPLAANVYANAQDAFSSATTAANAASAASTDAASILALSKLWLGSKTADPTLDNQGQALITGARYFNTTLSPKRERYYDGSAWQDGVTAISGVTSVNGQQGSVTIAAGGDVTQTGAQTLSNKTLASPISTGNVFTNGSESSNIVVVSALNIDCGLGNYFTKTIAANSTFTVSNIPTGKAYAFTLELTHTSGAVTWFANVVWPNNIAPTLTAGRVHLFTFITDNGGATWRAVANINYLT